MEINVDQISKKLRIISQNAWKIEGAATSINGIVEWMLKTAFEEVFAPIFEEMSQEIKDLQDEIDDLTAKEETVNVSEDGGVPKPNGSKKARIKVSGAEAGR